MNVNATLDGEAVVIVSMEKQRLTALVAYIDTQSGAGNLKLTEIPLEDLPLIMATGSEHIPPPWGVQKLDTTYWGPDGTWPPPWNGSAWESYTAGKGFEYIRLTIPTSKTWQIDYRPVSMRLLWTAGVGEMYIRMQDQSNNNVMFVTGESSDGSYNEYILDWSNNIDLRIHDTAWTLDINAPSAGAGGGAFELLDLRFSS